ncbi:MAG: class I adenylate-forming enzyme family protein [Deltaproteobacteria bacterium]
MTTLAETFEAAAQRAPDRDALVFAHGAVTYGELRARVYGAARALEGKTRVAIVAGSTVEALAVFWGAQWAGAETVDVPLHVGADAIAKMLEEARPDAIVTDAANQHLVPEARAVLEADDVAAPGEPVSRTPRAATDVAHIIYTSGTTGTPKGVMLSHENLLFDVEAAAVRMPLEEGSRLLIVVPMFFIHGRMQLIAHTRVAGTLCFSRGFRFPRKVVEELAQHRVHGMSGVPFHFATLLTRTRIAEASLPDLRYVLVTGGALDARMMGRLRRALSGIEIHTAYGSTEASPRVCHASPAELAARPSTAGRALPGVTIEVHASDGLPVPNGGLGQVVVRGPNVMVGYVSGDERTSGRIDESGALHTGDLGRLDADGYLFLSGRLSEMIKTAGERVFPREIEAVLERHPAVLEAAVVGLPDRVLGERIVAFVVPRPGQTAAPAALAEHARAWLPFVRSPREVFVVEALPKTASSKLRRNHLIALAQSEAFRNAQQG